MKKLFCLLSASMFTGLGLGMEPEELLRVLFSHIGEEEIPKTPNDVRLLFTIFSLINQEQEKNRGSSPSNHDQKL